MKSRTLVLIAILGPAVVGAAGGAWPNGSRLFGLGGSGEARRARADSLARYETDLIDLDIAFFVDRAARDPESAADRSSLASRYLQRARETGSYQDNRRAEEAARQSVALRSAHNGHTYGLLASSLMAQHRFGEALEAAHRLVEADSNALSSRALLGEVYLELGHYDSARVVFGELRTRRTLAIAPGLARWAEISGRLDQARSLFADAARMAWKDPNFRREQLAWFALREGELGLKRGKLADAERAFRRGLAVRPSDHRLLAALARLELARGRPRAAIDAAERAVALVFEPTTLGVLADAYLAAGDTTKSEEYARALETSIAGQPGAFHRAWSLFLLDHDRKLPEVLAKAREELETRRDVYGYDLLAWAWYKNGRIEESRAAINQALSLGTEDSSLLFHAAVIERAAGDDAAARLHLTRAMAINPYFQPSYRRTARAMLDSLEREEPR